MQHDPKLDSVEVSLTPESCAFLLGVCIDISSTVTFIFEENPTEEQENLAGPHLLKRLYLLKMLTEEIVGHEIDGGIRPVALGNGTDGTKTMGDAVKELIERKVLNKGGIVFHASPDGE